MVVTTSVNETQQRGGRLNDGDSTAGAAKIEQLRTTSADELEVIAGREREHLEGWVPALATEAEVREALEKAFDYRGDITVTRKDGTTVEGYLYDRRTGAYAGGFAGADDAYAEAGWPVERVNDCVRGHCGAGV